MKSLFLRISGFFRRERTGIAVFSALVLVGALSFEAGFLSGNLTASSPLVIEKPALPDPNSGLVKGVSAEDVASSTSVTKENCAFVGSRNSTLYHLPGCAVAKRIKPENVVCFLSAEDAAAKGYRSGCIK